MANATASETPYEFTVSIGGKAPVAVSHSETVVVSDLKTQERNLVVIKQLGKTTASFRFSFKEHESENLCLWFGPLYEKWSIWPLARSRGKCNCGSTNGA